jgi:DNA topoisomerase I
LPVSGYTLVVCEKPAVAKRVADALSEGSVGEARLGGASYYEFSRSGERFVVCAAQGHLYGVSDTFSDRAVYPVLDAEWYPVDALDDESKGAREKIDAMVRLAGGAAKFVNACDYDQEGETIGFNALRYACGGKEGVAFRAKFSTLTDDDLRASFRSAARSGDAGLAAAGRTRHLIDFLLGINLSRALSISALRLNRRYVAISVGRVQGPTLKFVVEREVEVRTFVPLPFWQIRASFEAGGERFVARYSEEKVVSAKEAQKVVAECSGKEGRVTSVSRSEETRAPPPAFNIGDLQREAYRLFGFTPSRTMQVAEKLYLSALISYPRTGSQKLPRSLEYAKLMRGLEKIHEYSGLVKSLPIADLRPSQGPMDDPAHPAIHPTGEKPRGPLEASERKLFDLVTRRFLAAFGESARQESVAVEIAVGLSRFLLGGKRTLEPGWMKIYGQYARKDDAVIPDLKEGDRSVVRSVDSAEAFEQPPRRYNPASLLGRMEREKIGTKATRSEVISTLVKRGYLSGDPLVASDLGFAVIEALEENAPSIISTRLTRDVEERLEKVEVGAEDERGVIRKMVTELVGQLEAMSTNERAIGAELGRAAQAASQAKSVLGRCPVCGNGSLRVIRSKKTGKRFVGCTNYSSGCRASAPLPQKGTVRATSRPCRHCSWPIVYVYGGRFPWRLCVNPGCPGKKGKGR